ncbi:MAG TPA: DUF2782 domain-containing protein [Luteimonas sp.]|nr:DUF2782 domain-containing protein [Luteimonas sp.]
MNPTTVTLLATCLALAACATTAGTSAGDIPAGAVQSTRTESNGDVVTEYRVEGRLRAVQVKPSRGPAYFLYDRDGDGLADGDDDGIQPVYFKLFGWD